MKIAVLSDQHGSLPTIPKCDLMVLSGDLTGGNPRGPRDQSDWYWYHWLATDFAEWTEGAPYTVAVAGNHDTCLEQDSPYPIPNFTYLRDSGCEFGGLKFWGTPWVRKWDTLAFNATDEEMGRQFDLVPRDTDVVVCHMPPFGAGDADGRGHCVGCKWVARTVQRVRPKLLTCGHIHEGRGVYDLYGTRVVNAAREFVVVEL